MSNKLIIPENNQEDISPEKQEFLALKVEVFESEDRFIKTSDAKITIDCIDSISKIKSQVTHLGFTERERVMEQVKSFKLKMEKFRKMRHQYLDTSIPEISRQWLDEKSSKIIDMFGRFYTPEDIYKVIRVDWGVEEVDLVSLQCFYEQHIETIQELRTQYKESIDDLRLTHKKVRLEELTNMYGVRKDIYSTTSSKLDEKALLDLLAAIRKETEGDVININGKLDITAEISIKHQLQQEILKDFNLSFLIVSHVAARLGINPLHIVNRLANSYYAKFSGFARSANILEEEIVYPTNLIYDFNEIAKKQEQFAIEDVISQEPHNLPFTEAQEILSIKQQLLAKISAMKR